MNSQSGSDALNDTFYNPLYISSTFDVAPPFGQDEPTAQAQQRSLATVSAVTQPPVGSVHVIASSSRPAAPINGRPPRSRKNRPCDSCRKGKTRCSISAAGPPCTQCLETRRNCTFELAPPARKPRTTTGVNGEHSDNHPGHAVMMDDASLSPAVTIGNKRARLRSGSGSRSAQLSSPSSVSPVGRRRRLGQSFTADDEDTRSSSMSTSGLDILAAAVPSFDQFASSDFEPHVLTNPLTDDLLPVTNDQEGSSVKDQDRRPYVKQLSSDPLRPVFVVMNPKAANSRSQSPGQQALFQLRCLFTSHPDRIVESELLELYYNLVHPALPIVLDTTGAKVPPSLLASVLAMALSHKKSTRALAPLAQSIVSAAAGHEKGNDMATVIEAVVELDTRPSQSSQSAYLSLARTIALAQLLGMHLSPEKWSIPLWERDLRVRLWWALEIHDAWMSFLNSRPSHIQERNSSVPLPTLGSVLLAGCAFSSASSDSAKAFIASCRLARLVSRLQRHVSTLGAVSTRSAEERGEEAAAIAKAADKLLDEWKDILSDTKPRATGVNSFFIHILGFRCMLKRISVELEHGFGSTFNPTPELLAPFADCVGLIEQLTEADLDGYYLNYASHILSSVTSSLIRFTLASPSTPNETATNLVGRLIRTLRKLHSEYNWDIAMPALRRAAAVSDRLKSLDEHDGLCEALKGSTSSTPSQLNSMVAPPPAAEMSFPQTVEPQLPWDWGTLDLDLTAFLGI